MKKPAILIAARDEALRNRRQRPCGKITLTDLPEQFRQRFGEAVSLPQDERERLLSALFSTNWNFSKAAQQLHWCRMSLYRKRGKYQIAKGEKPGQDATRVPPEDALSHLPRRCDGDATER
jgi:DNA-binding NtrC family response regulator